MDRHQPAYWLSRDPAEAADFLARTAVASRIVGGFVKAAQPTPGAPPPTTPPAAGGMHPDLQNALIGAGLGGLGGLGMGLMSKRKKNPLTSALTGAALGGTLGYALPAAWKGYQNMGTPPPNVDQEAQRKAKWDTLSGVDQATHRLRGTVPTLDAGPGSPGTPGGQTPTEQARDNTSYVDYGLKTVGEGASGLGNYAVTHPGAMTASGIIGTGQGIHAWKTAPAKKWENVRLGAMGVKPDPGTPAFIRDKSVPAQPGDLDPSGRLYPPGAMKLIDEQVKQVDPKDMGASRVKRFMQDIEPELGRVSPLGDRMLPVAKDWRWSRMNPFKKWNEGVLGSAVEQMRVGGVPTGSWIAGHMGEVPGAIGQKNVPGAGKVTLDPMTVPGMGGAKPTLAPGIASAISEMEHAGAGMRTPGTWKGMLGKGLMYAAPHAIAHGVTPAWNALSNYWNKGQGP